MKETIVPGVHDLIPPQGRVTVRLLDSDRPWRVRKEIKAENLLTDWWKSAADPGTRTSGWVNDTARSYQPSFSPNDQMTTAGFTKSSYLSMLGTSRSGKWPGLYSNYVNQLWVSSANITPDAGVPWIPTNDNTTGQLTAYACTDTPYALDANHLQRGTVNPTDSTQTWSKTRIVTEWGTTQGNGVWRSLGYGVVNPRISGSTCAPGPFGGYGQLTNIESVQAVNPSNSTAALATLGDPHNMSWDPVDSKFVYAALSNDQIAKLDAWNYTYTGGYSATTFTPGAAGTYNLAVSHDGTDLWVTRGKVLYRVDDTSINTVVNTYDLSATITESDIIDITNDGTDLYILSTTKIHKVNNLGVPQTSWAHGETSSVYHPGNIEYCPSGDFLWVAFNADGNWTASTQANEWSDWAFTGDCSWEGDSFRLRSWSKAGVSLPYVLKPGWKFLDDPFYLNSFSGMTPNGHSAFMGRSYYNDHLSSGVLHAWGPSAATHLNLGADITKTSNDTMQVIYDFDFA